VGTVLLLLLLAAVCVRSLLAINPGVVPPGAEVTVDAGVLVAVVAVVALAALVAGVMPALRVGATDVRTAIATGSVGGAKSGGRLRAALVAAEVALAAAMLVGAGLVGRSFQKLLAVDPGFQAHGALVMSVALPAVRYDTSTKVVAFYDRALERMRGLPGVRAPPRRLRCRWAVAPCSGRWKSKVVRTPGASCRHPIS
jgi:putative ABC transport system permease protein